MISTLQRMESIVPHAPTMALWPTLKTGLVRLSIRPQRHDRLSRAAAART